MNGQLGAQPVGDLSGSLPLSAAPEQKFEVDAYLDIFRLTCLHGRVLMHDKIIALGRLLFILVSHCYVRTAFSVCFVSGLPVFLPSAFSLLRCYFRFPEEPPLLPVFFIETI